jgi:hypothetical protein
MDAVVNITIFINVFNILLDSIDYLSLVVVMAYNVFKNEIRIFLGTRLQFYFFEENIFE